MVLGVYSGGALRLSASVVLTAPAGGAIAEFVAAVSAVNGELLWGRALEPNAAGDAPAIVAAPHIIVRARADVMVCATSTTVPVALVARGVDVVSTAADTPLREANQWRRRRLGHWVPVQTDSRPSTQSCVGPGQWHRHAIWCSPCPEQPTYSSQTRGCRSASIHRQSCRTTPPAPVRRRSQRRSAGRPQ